MRRLWRLVRWPLLVLVVVFVAIQFVPYGWKHSNPPVTQDAPWPDAESEHLARVACYDCHSNETNWPAYTYVAPISWLSVHDVEEGRAKLNFSEWDRDHGQARRSRPQRSSDGSMPPTSTCSSIAMPTSATRRRSTLIAALEQMDADD